MMEMGLKSETIITVIALFIIAILCITAALLIREPTTDVNGLINIPDNRTAYILTIIAASIAILAILIYLFYIGVTRTHNWKSWHDLVTFLSLIIIAILTIIAIVRFLDFQLARILLWVSFGIALLALFIVVVVDLTTIHREDYLIHQRFTTDDALPGTTVSSKQTIITPTSTSTKTTTTHTPPTYAVPTYTVPVTNVPITNVPINNVPVNGIPTSRTIREMTTVNRVPAAVAPIGNGGFTAAGGQIEGFEQF